MICPECGKEISVGNEKKNSKGMLTAFAVTAVVALVAVVFLVLSLTGVLGSGDKEPAKAEGAGFESPEKCMESYMEYMKNGDYQGMLSCYAIESFAENYDMNAYVERMQCLTPNANLIITDDEFSKNMSSKQIEQRVNEMIRKGIWNIAQKGLFINGTVVSLDEYDSADALISDMLPSGLQNTLSTITYNGTVDNYSETFSGDFENDSIKENEQKLMNMYGSEDFAHAVTDFSVGKNDYYLLVDVVKYNDKWYICPTDSFICSILGVPVYYGNIVSQNEY